MFKKIINFIKLDIALALKDNIAIYMIFSPLLLAVGARAFLPTLDNMQGTVAIQQQVDLEVRNAFTNYMKVEVLPDEAAVVKRVQRPDDIPGLILKEGRPVVIVEGNEQGEMVEGFSLIVDHIVDGKFVSAFEDIIIPGSKLPVTEYITISLIMLGILLGSLIAGFNIVHEREKGAIKALGVAPLKFSHYILARGTFSLVLGLFISLGIAIIMMGVTIPFAELILSSVLGLGLIMTLGLLIGGLAANQVQALGVIKILMTAFLSLPIISIFVPQNWHWVFYIFPNYWLFRAYEYSLMGDFRGLSYPAILLILGLSSIVMLIAVIPVIKRRLKIR